jgi:hypothetical protein
MSLERKDVRFKLDPDEHEALKEICDFDGRDVGEWVEQLVLLEMQRRAAEAARAIALHERLSRLGVSGKNREAPGVTGNDRDGRNGSGRR